MGRCGLVEYACVRVCDSVWRKTEAESGEFMLPSSGRAWLEPGLCGCWFEIVGGRGLSNGICGMMDEKASTSWQCSKR